MSAYLWGYLFVLSVLLLWILQCYLRLHFQSRSRGFLYKERLAAMGAGQPGPPAEPFALEGGNPLLVRLAAGAPKKVLSLLGTVSLGLGAGVSAGFRCLPDVYVLHDFWSLGFIGVATGLGLIIYVIFYR